MEYTINKLAKIAGVTSRTLRYYDEIDLLIPKRINSSGYRIYGQKEVDLLQQILFYRALDLPLEEIKQIIYHPNFDSIEALKNHQHELINKREQIDEMIQTIEKTIESKKGGIPMQDDEKFACFKEKLIEENEATYGDEIREKYGTDTVEKSNAKLRGMSQQDFQAMTELGEEIISLLKQALEQGDPTSIVAQTLAQKHKQWLMYSWPTYSKEAHQNLVDMYLEDERFTNYYDEHVKGGTQFLRAAVHHFIDQTK